MTDFETQVLEAFVPLTPYQRQAALELLRLLAEGTSADCLHGEVVKENG